MARESAVKRPADANDGESIAPTPSGKRVRSSISSAAKPPASAAKAAKAAPVTPSVKKSAVKAATASVVKTTSPTALRPADAVPDAGKLPVRRGVVTADAESVADEHNSAALTSDPKDIDHLTRLLLPAYFPLVVLLLWLAALIAVLQYSVYWLPPAAVHMLASFTTAPLRLLNVM